MSEISKVLPYNPEMLKKWGYGQDNALRLPYTNVISRRRTTQVNDGSNTPYRVVVAIPIDNDRDETIVKEMCFDSCWAKPDMTPEEIATANFEWHFSEATENYPAGMVAHFVRRKYDDEEIDNGANED